MTQNKKIIIGNWKMNFTMNEASLYLHKLANLIQAHRSVDVVLAPSVFTLQSLSLQINKRQFKLATQNFYWRDFGAFTGEVAIAQLKNIVEYAIVGHSERRHIFHETDKDIRGKVQAALRSGIKPILCVGETIVDRSAGETKDVLNDQLLTGLANVTSEDIANCGQSAQVVDVAKAVAIIRDQIGYLFGKKASTAVRVVYGGSVTSDNALGFLQIKGVDGLMMGGSSLNAYQFNDIIEKTYNLAKEGGN